MSIDEAIKVLKEYLTLDEDIDNEYLEAQKVAIKALEEQQNPNSIRINFVGEKEAEEFKEYLKNQQESVLDKIKSKLIEEKEVIMDDLYLHKMEKKMIELRQTIKDDLSALNQICENHPNSVCSTIAIIELLEEYIEILEDKE